MNKNFWKKSAKLALGCFAACQLFSCTTGYAAALDTGFENASAALKMNKIAGYSANAFNTDGGVMEIISYNPVNGYAYAVNGKSGKLTAISLLALNQGSSNLTGIDTDVKQLVEAADKTFSYGDMTSVSVSPDGKRLAVALQAKGYNDNGKIALFDCGKQGGLTLTNILPAGVQPDMVTFADAATVLTANEGEPREGYGKQVIDPAGSVTIADLTSMTSVNVGFAEFDNQKATLAAQGIVLKKDALPSVDLEPEYIAVDNGKAFISLQEANAVAVLDIKEKKYDCIYSVGFENHGLYSVDLNKKDEAYSAKLYKDLLGIRMPDSIAAFNKNGKTYLVTANEGDGREWGDEDLGTAYLNEDERNFKKDTATSPTGKIKASPALKGKVVFFDATDYDGLKADKDYLFGGRSFTMYEVKKNKLQEVFTSGNDFEKLTSKYVPEYFNCSNDDASIDSRSGKKGPEPESVAVGNVNGKTYAFIALERTGGIMAYDITNPAKAKFVNYINSRDFNTVTAGSEEYEDGKLDKWVTGGDVAPEGLAFIDAQNSPTGNALLLTACEVSGTVAVYELK